MVPDNFVHFFLTKLLIILRFKVLTQTHICSSDFLLLKDFFVALFHISLDSFLYSLNFHLAFIVKPKKLQLDFIEHNETKNQDLWHHVGEQIKGVAVLIDTDLCVSTKIVELVRSENLVEDRQIEEQLEHHDKDCI